MDASADLHLANAWQRSFPLCRRPFLHIAAAAGISEAQVLERFRRLCAARIVDRVGPVFRPNTVGASSLAAMAVPARRLDAVAAQVSRQPGVNHNYERDHRVNLWFVVTAPTRRLVQRHIAGIEAANGIRVLRLPLLEEFHIDLGFDLRDGQAPRGSARAEPRGATARERRLVAALARGLPLVAEPYRQVARAAGVSEEEALAMLDRMLSDGRIRRIGAVIRHRKVGYRANAMVVWDVPAHRVSVLGRRLAGDPAVTLCYRRRRALPDWPYNLYCMVHGRERRQVLAQVERASRTHGLEGLPRAVLFSERCFAQRAASYG